MKNFLNSLPVTFLILLFVYAALSKLIGFSDFTNQMYHQPFPREVANVLIFALPTTEICAATFLLFPKTFLTGLQLSLSLLIVFSAYIALVLMHWWRKTPCSCGGMLSHLSWPEHLIFNCFFICLNLIAIHLYFKERRSLAGDKQ